MWTLLRHRLQLEKSTFSKIGWPTDDSGGSMGRRGRSPHLQTACKTCYQTQFWGFKLHQNQQWPGLPTGRAYSAGGGGGWLPPSQEPQPLLRPRRHDNLSVFPEKCKQTTLTMTLRSRQKPDLLNCTSPRHVTVY